MVTNGFGEAMFYMYDGVNLVGVGGMGAPAPADGRGRWL